tara:strand:- start:273 stop:845 length:573 start_codon:yes stop_codon:yes gene_type:complete
MSKTNKMILFAALVILFLVWYLSDREILKQKEELSDIYSFGTLNTNPSVNWVIKGCTDPSAANYNADATSDDGTCYTIAGCCDLDATNYNPEADSCNIPQNNEILCEYGQTGWILSDKRLKENIIKINYSKSGIPIYHFNYKGDDKTWSGTMAQDLIDMGREDAIGMKNGYYIVNYNLIDVNMKEIIGNE